MDLDLDLDLIVVGEGIAGLSCAGEAARLGLKVGTFEAAFFGGLVVNVNELQNFDEAAGLSGMDHAGMLAMGNKKAGVTSKSAAVTAVRAVDGGFELDTDAGMQRARFVVIASGATPRKLGVPGEDDYEGRGVSHCADCDAPMFTGNEVVVAGGGNWALQDAMVLSPECSLVHVVHEGGELSACTDYIDRVKADPKIRIHSHRGIDAVLGNDSGMTGVRVRDAQGGAHEIAAAGLFTMVGLEPNGAIAPAGVQRDGSGHLVVNEELETAVPGLWAIGQVRAGFGGWLNDAVADARRAAAQVKARAG